MKNKKEIKRRNQKILLIILITIILIWTIINISTIFKLMEMAKKLKDRTPENTTNTTVEENKLTKE